MAASRLFRWLTEQYAAYTALPVPVRAAIERVVHFLGLFLLGMAGGLAAGFPWKQAALASLLPAGGGQVSLKWQLPRNPGKYQDRTQDRVVDEDSIQ